MPTYLAYPTKKTTPSRNARKGSRTQTFLANKNAAKKIRKERKAARDAAREAAEYEEVIEE